MALDTKPIKAVIEKWNPVNVVAVKAGNVFRFTERERAKALNLMPSSVTTG